MQIAYLVASYKNPDQTLRLAKKLATESSSFSRIFIHHDYSATFLDKNIFTNSKIEIIENSISVKWGDISMVKMMIYCMGYIKEKMPEIDWLVIISGQDYPIEKMQEIEGFLSITEYDGFLTHFSSNHSVFLSSTIAYRYCYVWYDIPNHWRIKTIYKYIYDLGRRSNFISFFGGVLNSSPKIGIRRRNTIFCDEFKCYKGQPWMTINRKCINYIYETIFNKPKILKFYGRTLIPEESIFNTILANNPKLQLKNDCLRYIEWPNEWDSHPKILSTIDFEKIVTSKKHFARKFDINVDKEVLDMIDRRY